MSLQSLTKLRIEKRRAPPIVWVLVGNIPKWIEEHSPDMVAIRPGATDFDFRALIGLHVDVFELGDHCALLEKTLTALDSVHPKSRGLACLCGVAGTSPEHERILKNAKEHLCN